MPGENPSARTRPRDAPLPLPLAKTLRIPAVMPLAAAVYCSSPMSMTQAPRPIGTPERLAVYRASTFPWARQSIGNALKALTKKAATQR